MKSEGIGAVIRNVAAVRGLSLGEVAEKSGMSASNLSKIHHNDIRVSTLLSLCKALGITPNELLCIPKSEVQVHVDMESRIIIKGLKEMERACDRVRDELRDFYSTRPARIRKILDP